MQCTTTLRIAYLILMPIVTGFSQPDAIPDTQGRASFETDRLVRHVMTAPGGGSPESDPLIRHFEAHERKEAKKALKKKQLRSAGHNLNDHISEARAWTEKQQRAEFQRRKKQQRFELAAKNSTAKGFSK
eukprot:gnl/MRDRNA2_/MRDRNA2_92393_c0_seq1.p1 gnl/MRDRNA2_/MRDRNA2_92393_c0~~gnl/MRDRNA2_/MRDRNA2_92393_c0_seq1.p1  ORF type:complete len:130 (+),score=23.61 gnl/MRDRNA2_/MRDRNA2_92393_c0_seq1:86-475(+)